VHIKLEGITIVVSIALGIVACGEHSATFQTATVNQMENRGKLAYRKGGARPFTGMVKGSFPDGHAQSTFHYKDGKRHGLAVTYYQNGHINTSLTYVDGAPQGLVTVYYENGHKLADVPVLDGKAQGLVTEYGEDGNKVSECDYLAGFKRGTCKQWGKNGFYQQYKVLGGGEGLQFE